MKNRKPKYLFSLIATLAITGPSFSQESDPFLKDSSSTKTLPSEQEGSPNLLSLNPNAPLNIMVTYEAFSVPIAEAPKLCRGGFTNKSLYTALTANVEKHSVILENYSNLVVINGQAATSEAISEFIYPTEYDRAQIVTTEEGATVAPVRPTSFQTKNLGFTLEWECVIDQGPNYVALNKAGADLLASHLTATDNGSADPFALDSVPRKQQIANAISKRQIKAVTILSLRVTPTHVEKVANQTWGQGFSETEMPTFDVQSIKTGMNIVSGEPALLGTMNPHPQSPRHTDGKRVWFSFITTTVMSVGP